MNAVIRHSALALAMSLVLTGCEAEQADSPEPTRTTAQTAPQPTPEDASPRAERSPQAEVPEASPASARNRLADADACQLLSDSEIQAVVGTEAQLRQLSPCEGDRQCRYRWPKPNADQLRSQIVKKIADGNFGDDPFHDFHLLHPEFSMEITLMDAEATADDFIPPQTPATVPEDIEPTGDGEASPEDAAPSRPAGGTGRNSLAQTVPDLGDAAYWQPGSIDELHVRVGDQRLVLAVFASEDPDRNAKIARQLARQMLAQDAAAAQLASSEPPESETAAPRR